jgi:hypothetical protein
VGAIQPYPRLHYLTPHEEGWAQWAGLDLKVRRDKPFASVGNKTPIPRCRSATELVRIWERLH